jgi:hypothetical protein
MQKTWSRPVNNELKGFLFYRFLDLTNPYCCDVTRQGNAEREK